MRATCRGARSGRMAIVTSPRVVSSTNVLSGSRFMRPLRFRLSFGVSGHLHANDAIGIGNSAVLRGRALFDVIDRLHAGDDLADAGVLPVQAGHFREDDRELTVRRIGV